MAITAQQQQNIIALTVGMFGAAPGARNLSDFAANFEFNNQSYVALANDLISTSAYKSQYAGVVTLEGRIDKALANLGIDDQDSDAYTIAQEYFMDRASQGASEAQILVEALTYLLGDNADEAFADVQEQLANRVEVATYFSVEQQRSSDNLAELQSVVSSVTADDASVEAAKQAIDSGAFNPGQEGQIFTLTAAGANASGIDNIEGTAGNDTFRALAAGSLEDSDIINGGAGRDTLNISDDAITGSAAPVINSVETINNAGAGTLDLSNVSGVELVNSRGAGGTYDYDNADASTVFSVTNNTAASFNVAIDYEDGADTANLAVANTGTASSVSTVAFDLDGNDDLEAINLNVMGGNNEVVFSNASDVETVTITGAGNLEFSSANTDELTTFDASAATGNIRAVFGISGTADDEVLTATGGAGNDLLASNINNAVLNGGAGNDILGGSGSNLTMTGGEGKDEFHFNTGNQDSTITDFTVGEDVISLLQGAGGLEFANSTNSGINGSSDLNAADFSKFASFANLDAAAANGQVVVFTEAFEDQDAIEAASNGSAGSTNGAAGTGSDAFFFMAFNEDAGNGQLYVTDGQGSTNLVADVEGVDLAGVQALTAANFDIYV